MKCSIYARQSLTREGSESLETQVQACKEAAERLGLEVVAEFVEPPSTSGYKHRGTERKKFKELLEGFRSGQFEVVIAYKTDRLSRGGGPGWAPLLDAIEAAGLDTDRAVATPAGYVSEFELGIRATMDREESKKTSERTRDAHLHNARAGKPHGSRRVFGYEPDLVTVRESEATVLRRMADMVITGRSYRDIVCWLGEQEVSTTDGYPWRIAHIRRVLTNKRYAGIRTHKGAEYPAQWPAIFDAETWQRLQLAIELHATAHGQHYRTYLLTGLLYCGRCGNRLTGCLKANTKGGEKWRNYICQDFHERGHRHGCGGLRRVAEPLEHYVEQRLLERLADPELGLTLVAGGKGEAIISDMLAEKELQERRVDELIADYYTNGLLSKQQFVKAKAAAEAELERINADVERFNRERLSLSVPDDMTLREAWEQADSDDWRRSLLSGFIKAITVKPTNKRPFYWIGERRYRFDPDSIEITWTT